MNYKGLVHNIRERERERARKVFAGWDRQYFAGSDLGSFRGIGNVIGCASLPLNLHFLRSDCGCD